MESLVIYLGALYILLGCIFWLIHLIYLEVGRPKDLIKAALNLLIGIILIIKNKVFEEMSILIFVLATTLIVLYQIEIFLSRWNQLTHTEKNKLTTLMEFKKNISKIFEAIYLGVSNFKNSLNFLKYIKNNQNINKKKWVRNDKNDNIEI